MNDARRERNWAELRKLAEKRAEYLAMLHNAGPASDEDRDFAASVLGLVSKHSQVSVWRPSQ